MRKKLVGLALALILALTTFTSSALAYDCIIASRSDTGNVMAGTQSKTWYYIGNSAWLFQNVHEFIGGGAVALTPSQVDWAVAEAAAQGLPSEFTTFTNAHVGGGAGVLLYGTPADNPALMSNGKGVDHFEDFASAFIAIYFEALSH